MRNARLMKKFTEHGGLLMGFSGNEAGTGGLVTFMDSNWLMSIVLARQPHFIGQPADVNVLWGYSLFVEQEGNFIRKKMSECNGTTRRGFRERRRVLNPLISNGAPNRIRTGVLALRGC
jgi:myosin-crossreactive antigen